VIGKLVTDGILILIIAAAVLVLAAILA